jgi:hypothetical protein
VISAYACRRRQEKFIENGIEGRLDDDAKQKIAVLLAEYNTLRTEVIAARTAWARVIEFTVLVIMAAVGLGFSNTYGAHHWYRFP